MFSLGKQCTGIAILKIPVLSVLLALAIPGFGAVPIKAKIAKPVQVCTACQFVKRYFVALPEEMGLVFALYGLFSGCPLSFPV